MVDASAAASSPAWSPCSPAPTSPTSRAPAVRVAGDRRHVLPDHPRSPSTRSGTPARPSPCVVARTVTPPPTRSRPSTSTMSRFPPSSTWPRRSLTAPTCARRQGHQHVLRPGCSSNGDLDAAFRDAPVVIERRYRAAAADPHCHGAAGRGLRAGRRRYTIWSSTQIPHVLRLMLATVPASPRTSSGSSPPTWAAGSAPSCRCTAEELLACCWPSGSAGRSSGPSRAARATWPRTTAATRSSASSWPPTPTGRSAG